MNSVDHRNNIRKKIMDSIRDKGMVPSSISVTRDELAYLWLNGELEEVSKTQDGKSALYRHREIYLTVEDK